MALSYTVEQLDRETSLAAYEVIVLADNVLGDGAGLRALGVEKGEELGFATSRHPDFLDVTQLAIWPSIQRIERYVNERMWSNEIVSDINLLRLLVERVFSPDIVAGYAAEKAEADDSSPTPGKFEEGAGDVLLGFFHRGILRQLLDSASARLKLDQGERLTMGEVALLVDAKEPTIVTNAHRKNFVTVEEENRRYAEPASVIAWMVKNGYRPTALEHSEDERPGESVEEDDYLFVPVSGDGSIFDPTCRYGGRYQVGAKGDETKYSDYFEALSALQAMPKPRWRRKNSEGNAGIVTGTEFERIRRSELLAQLAHITSIKGK